MIFFRQIRKPTLPQTPRCQKERILLLRLLLCTKLFQQDSNTPRFSDRNYSFLGKQPSCVVSHLPCGETIGSTALPDFVQQIQQEPKLQKGDFQEKVNESQGWLTNNQQPPANYAHEASIPPNHIVFATNNGDMVAQNVFGVKRYDALRCKRLEFDSIQFRF